MGKVTKIQWTNHTFNPWWGCTKVSPGCAHCYAETLDKRFGGGHWGPGAARKRTSAKNWAEPLKWNADSASGVSLGFSRARVFCASMADVFDAEVPAEWRADLWDLIRKCASLDWLLLTKRPGNIPSMLPADWGDGWPHVWPGTTVENQEEAERRIPLLVRVPARLRFLSCEPLLGPVDLCARFDLRSDGPQSNEWRDVLRGKICTESPVHGRRDFDSQRIGWVIAGGESGRGARPMHPAWARSLRDQCARAGVPFFFKQWGNYGPTSVGEARGIVLMNGKHYKTEHDWLSDPGASDSRGFSLHMPAAAVREFGKEAAGRALDGREHNEFPASPALAAT